MSVLASYATFVSATRVALFYLGALMAAICAVDWAVRTRRINPFNRVARFFRSSIDPLMLPVERAVVRAGGLPASAAWWSLVAFVVGGIILISLLDFVGNILFQIMAVSGRPADLPRLLASWAFAILRLALLVRVVSSWLPISPYSKWVRWSFQLTEWMIAPLRRVIPLFGMIDITPLVAWFGLSLIQRFLGIP
jgi:YggT family protein